MANKNLRERAAQFSNLNYATDLFKEKTTDGEFVYIAVHPNLEGCMAQGETPEEAMSNLDDVRVDYLEHLLEFNLPIPGPVATETRETSTVSSVQKDVHNIAFPGFENYLDQVFDNREKILSVVPST